MKAARATRTRVDAATRTALCTGSTHTSRPRLTTVTRQTAARLSTADPARTTLGPPPMTVGTRCERAPESSWAAKPAAMTAATRP